MVRHVESGNKRWILKAVREVAGELMQLYHRVDEAGLRWRPAPDEWCMKEIAAHMRDAEHLYLRQIEAIAHGERGRLPYEPVEVYPSERDYRDEPVESFLWEFESAREETVWTLYALDEQDWERTGEHPYRGTISIYDIAREMHEHDLQYLIMTRRLREQIRGR
jgi:hypothetical protein